MRDRTHNVVLEVLFLRLVLQLQRLNTLDVQQTVDKYLRGLNDNLYFVSSLEGIPRHNYASSCEKSRQNNEASRGTRAQSCTDPARKGEFIFGTLETHDLFKHCYVQKASQFNKIGYSHVPKPL